MPPVDDCLAVRGLGLRLPGVADAAELARLVDGAPVPSAPVRRFTAPEAGLAPLEWRTHAPVAPRLPTTVTGRGLRAVPPESLLALAVAAEAGTAPPDDPPDPWQVTSLVDPVEAGRAAVLWASSTAGLAEYARICVEAATLDPGLSSPIIGPASAFNGPAATVSIRLGLDGPNETTTGGTTAGLTALVEAARLLADGAATRALVGGSATVSRWSLAGLADGFAAGEGAACLAVSPCLADEPGIRLGRFRRTSLDRSDLAAHCRALVRAARPAGSGWAAGPPAGAPPARHAPEHGVPGGGAPVERVGGAAIAPGGGAPVEPIGGAAAWPGGGAPAWSVGGEPVGPVGTIVSTVDSELVEALAGEAHRPVWHLERALGDFGAAGGLMAAACAVAYCANTPAPTSLLAVAIEPSGNAAILEVSSWPAPTSSSGWWGERSRPVGASGPRT